AKGERCVLSQTLTLPCDPADPDRCSKALGAECDPRRQFCVCGAATTPPPGYHCTMEDGVALMKRFVCHTPGACQSADRDAANNAGKACCMPGTDTPIGAAVCGQCDAHSKRDAAAAVYCSCRCGVADGDPAEPDFDFCTCPSGFTCSQIRFDLP